MKAIESKEHFRFEVSWTPGGKFTFDHKQETIDTIGEFIMRLDRHLGRYWELWEEIKADPEIQKSWREKHHKPYFDPPLGPPD